MNGLASVFSMAAQGLKRLRHGFNQRAAEFALKNAHVIMTAGYLMANIIVTLGRVIENPYEYDPEKVGGFVSIIGSAGNLYNRKYPILFTLCGLTTVLKTSAIAVFGHEGDAILEHVGGMVMPTMAGLIMLTDRRFHRLRADSPRPEPIFKEGTAINRMTKGFNQHRCAIIAPFLTLGRPAHVFAAWAQRDYGQMLYTALDYLGDWGLLFRDPETQDRIKKYARDSNIAVDRDPVLIPGM